MHVGFIVDSRPEADVHIHNENIERPPDRLWTRPSCPLARLYNNDLPSFVRPLPSRLSPPVSHLLREKLALSAPSLELQNALWLAYLKSVHPFMPVLDAHSVFAIMQRRDGSKGQVSLLLYHAIMLAGLHSVDMDYLRAAGYTLRKTCLNDAFEVVKVSLSPHDRVGRRDC